MLELRDAGLRQPYMYIWDGSMELSPCPAQSSIEWMELAIATDCDGGVIYRIIDIYL